MGIIVSFCFFKQKTAYEMRISDWFRRVLFRSIQGPGARQSRAPVPGDQAPIRLREDTLPWPGEEHRAVGDTVCAVEPVDGAPTFADECKIGRASCRERVCQYV